jgi:hypothetical protein
MRDPGSEIEPFHMFPFEKSLSGAARDEMYFQWFDMARLNYLMARFSALMQIPIQETPYSVALDIFPKPGQPQDCLQGFYGNYELFSAAPPAPSVYRRPSLLFCISFSKCGCYYPPAMSYTRSFSQPSAPLQA